MSMSLNFSSTRAPVRRASSLSFMREFIAQTEPRAVASGCALHEVDGVDLDVDRVDVAAGLGGGFAECHFDERAEARAAARLEQKLDAVLAAQARERGGRGAENAAAALRVGAVERFAYDGGG